MNMKRKFTLLICLAGCALGVLQAQTKPLNVVRQGNRLLVTAPQLHFIAGKPLEQLHNGASVTYLLTLTLDAAGSPAVSARERFIVSYDLWEEKYSVVQAEPAGRAASHLSATAAESWCLENMQIPVGALGPDKSFVLRLECTVEEPDKGEGASGLTLAGLIDVFSRKKHEEVPRWEAASGSLRMSDLKDKNQARPSRD